MKKQILYMMITILIVVIAGFFLLGKTNTNADTPPSNANAAASNNSAGDFQKVVLSMKNYNYYPNTITVKAGKPVRIYLDASVVGCYRSFTIRSFGIAKYLKTTDDYIEFTPTKTGTFGFSCSMGMGRGTLVVE